MTAIVHYQSTAVPLDHGETVLDALLRSGFDIPHGCKAGACHACMLQSESELPATAQAGLKENQKSLGYFLACQCKPAEAITIAGAAEATKRSSAEVISIQSLSKSVVRLQLKADFKYIAGQYINLWKDPLTCRSYSLASIPTEDNILELHIKIFEHGVFGQWIENDLRPGDKVDISGPMGECFYSGDKSSPLLMLAMGTGLAPIYGILQDALVKGHVGKINIVAAARDANDLYYLDLLSNMAKFNPQLNTHFVAQCSDGRENVTEADVYSYVKAEFSSTKGYRVYLCGGENFVKKMKRQAFLAGANMPDIYADVFLAFGE
ncbi:NAD(P)H-flavin reductase [Alteromonadaceae bacterium Bs31]|nr:NAD(P)H-flavin reductase [Alteromonadaceae bacterium Bs31]